MLMIMMIAALIDYLILYNSVLNTGQSRNDDNDHLYQGGITIFVVYFWFRKTGYDRGHLAASANHRLSQEANCQTFFLSNISPQVGMIDC